MIDTHKLVSLIASADAFVLAPQVTPSATLLAACNRELRSLTALPLVLAETVQAEVSHGIVVAASYQ